MTERGRRLDPLGVCRFEIRLTGAGRPIRGGFSECTGLEAATEIVEYREGGVNDRVHKFPGHARQANIVMGRGIVDRELYDWYQRSVAGDLQLLNGSIELFDASGTEVVMEWSFQKAFPCRWVGPRLNAVESAVAVETLELCHDGLSRTR
jgi:phage tail-like protein